MPRTLHHDWILKAPHYKEFLDAIAEDPNRWPDFRARLNAEGMLGIQISNTIGALLAFRESGCNVAEVQPHVWRMFDQIDLTGVQREDLFLPHECVYIDLPDFDETLWASDRYVPLQGLYLWRMQKSGVPSTVLLRGELVQGEFWTVYLWASDGHPSDDAFYLAGFQLDAACENGIETYIANALRDCERPLSHMNMTPEKLDAQQKIFLRVLRIAINTVLYWTSPEARIEVTRPNDQKIKRLSDELNKAKRPRQKRKIKDDLDKISRIRLTKFKIDEIADPHTVADGKTRVSPRRHKVPAHWRWYWIGPSHPLWERATVVGDDSRKRKVRKLIAEFWRGEPASGRVVGRVHVVG